MPSRALALLILVAAGVTPALAAASEQGWRAPVDLSPGYLYTYPQLEPDAGGGFVYTWDENFGDSNNRIDVHAARVSHSGTVSAQQLTGLTFYGTYLAGDDAGDAIATWEETSNDCCDTLSAAIKTPGSGFGPTQSVPYGSGYVLQTRPAMNRHGDAVVVYQTSDGHNVTRLWAVFRPAGGSFSAPVAVSDPASNSMVDNWAVGLTANDQAVVVWDAPPSSMSCANGSCTSNTFPPVISAAIGSSSGFAAPQVISDPAGTAYTPKLAVAPDGAAVATWESGDGPDGPNGQPTHSVSVAVRQPGGAFGAPEVVGVGNLDPFPDVGIDDTDHALVSYSDENFEIDDVPIDARAAAIGAVEDIAGVSGYGRLAVGPAGQALIVLETPIVLGESPPSAATWLSWGTTTSGFGRLRNLTCPQPWYSLLWPSVGADGSGAALLLNRGTDTRDDTDDRNAIALSDPAIAPNTAGCPGHEASRPGPPTAPAPGNTSTPAGNANQQTTATPPTAASAPGPVGPSGQIPADVGDSTDTPLVRIRRVAGGLVHYTITAPMAGTLRVAPRLRIGTRTIALTPGTYQLRGPATMRLRLLTRTRAVRRIRGRHHRGRLTLLITTTGLDGAMRSTQLTVTIAV